MTHASGHLAWLGKVAVALVTLSACQTTGVVGTNGSPTTAACTIESARGQLTKLFEAFSAGDSAAVLRLIETPQPGRDGLEMTPTLPGFIEAGAGSPTDIQVHNTVDLHRFMADLRGFRFEESGREAATIGVRSGESGPDALNGLAVGFGPLLWTARPTQGRSIAGGGKASFSCASGRFVRALFSPGAYS